MSTVKFRESSGDSSADSQWQQAIRTRSCGTSESFGQTLPNRPTSEGMLAVQSRLRSAAARQSSSGPTCWTKFLELEVDELGDRPEEDECEADDDHHGSGGYAEVQCGNALQLRRDE